MEPTFSLVSPQLLLLPCRFQFISLVSTGTLPDDKMVSGRLEPDGFPSIGTYLQEGDPFYRCCYGCQLKLVHNIYR